MANVLLPAAGKRKDTERLEFSFQAVRKVPDVGCVGFSCENIPEYLYDFKCTDYQLEEELCRQQNMASRLLEHQPPHRQSNTSDNSHLCNTTPNVMMTSPGNGVIKGSNCSSCHRTETTQSTTNNNRDVKRPVVPMPNCHHLYCCGKRRHCAMPDEGLWGHSVSDVTNCGWNKAQHDHTRLPDPQVVRPRDKNADRSARPSGQPYFTHERKGCQCVPAQAPKATPNGFNFEQWLATQQNRQPPAGLQDKCVTSLCNLCGPRTVPCCPGHSDPSNYWLVKKV